MAANLDTDIRIRLQVTHKSADLDLSTPTDPVDIVKNLILVNGTGGAGTADLVYHDKRTLSASAAESLDLSGVLLDKFLGTITFVRLKMVYIFALAANTNDVLFGRHATNGSVLFSAASDEIVIKPGGIFFWYATDGTAIPVANSSTDIFKVTNSAGSTSVTYEIVIIGGSA